MPLVFGDRVKETSTSVGLSSFALDGAVLGFQSFSDGIGNGNQCFYTIENETDSSWEVGIGTVAGATFSRDSVLSSSNGGLPVNFAAGSKQVFATEAAQHFNNTLDVSDHSTLDHTGIPGVGGSESFTAPVHATTDHTGLPGVPVAEVFTSVAHLGESHLSGPWSLLNEAAHDLLDHTGLTGVGGTEAYDQAAHDADDHTGATLIAPPSQSEAETGTALTGRLWTAERVAQAVAAQTGFLQASMVFTAVNTITMPVTFLPKVVLFVGKYVGLSGENTIGFATSNTVGAQGCTVGGSSTGAAIEELQGSIAADTNGTAAVTDSHDVTTYGASSVIATQSTGAVAWSGLVIALGG